MRMNYQCQDVYDNAFSIRGSLANGLNGTQIFRNDT